MKNLFYSAKLIVTLAFVFGLSVCSRSQILFNINGANETYITGINSNTDVCGYAVFSGDVIKGFVKTKTDTILLEYLANVDTWTGGINDLGQVVGRYNQDGLSTGYHAYIYDINTNTFTGMPQMDGYENLSPNDINNEGWISGDLKDAAQRRIFTYHEDQGMYTNFVMIESEVKPTYGGHDIDAFGRTSAYYIDGGTYISGWYQEGQGFSDWVDLPDPLYTTNHKTKISGCNSGFALINFQASKRSYSYNTATNELDQQLRIPGAIEIYALDINEEGYIAGYYLDASYVPHGFYQAKASIDFLPSVNGWSFVNSAEDSWNELDYALLNYNDDPYMQEVHNTSIPFPLNDQQTVFPSSSFGSWPDMVKAFGEDKCYLQDPNVPYLEQHWYAFGIWKQHRHDSFRGICWGMVSNSLLSYDSLEVLEGLYPDLNGMLAFDNPASQDMADNDLHFINPARVSHWRQFSSTQWPRVTGGFPETIPVIAEINTGLNTPGDFTKQIVIYLEGQAVHGYHAIMPYRMERDADNINLYHVYVYDPNEPLDDTKNIEVLYEDTAYYRYDFGGTYTAWTTLGLRYDEWSDCFTDEVYISGVAADENQYRDGEVILSVLNDPDVSMTGPGAGSLSVVGDSYSSDLEGGRAVFRITGINEKPYIFKLDPGAFYTTLTSVEDGSMDAILEGETGRIEFTRNNALEGEEDGIHVYGGQLGYENLLGMNVNVDAHILISDQDGTIYEYTCDNISVAGDQVITMEIIDATHVYISSEGAASTYNVNIRIFNEETGFWEATATNISIGNNVTQQIIPDMNDDSFDGIIIETDANQDGEFETTNEEDNEGIPAMMLSEDEFSLDENPSTSSFYVSNIGGGNLNWTVSNIPSWITIDEGSTGINHGPVSFTTTANPDLSREAWLVVEATAPASDMDSVYVFQWGANGIEDSDASRFIKVLPNPATEVIQILSAWKTPSRYEIINAVGEVVATGTISGTATIDVSTLARGSYHIRITNDRNIAVKKLILH